MRFLLDANLPRSTVASFVASGDEAVHVRDIGLGDAADGQIVAHAQSHGLVLVTRDLDFADVRAYPPEQSPGIVVLRMPDHAIASEIAAVVCRFLAHREIVERLAGRLAVVDRERVRVRPPLE